MSKLFFKSDPFVDKNKEYVELDPIDIIGIYGACNDYVSLSITEDYSIDIRCMYDIQKEIQNLWNYTDVLRSYRNN